MDRKDHLIIIGFGVNGRNVAHSAKVAGIPYVIIEMNPKTVRSEQAKGKPIYYGDATHEIVLQHTNIKEARIVVVAINDPAATRRIAEGIRRLNPKVHLIVRTRYLQEMKPLYELGACEVIPEEFETSVEIFTQVLTKYLMPRDEIERLVADWENPCPDRVKRALWDFCSGNTTGLTDIGQPGCRHGPSIQRCAFRPWIF